MTKKITAIFLALCMAISVLPMTIQALSLIHIFSIHAEEMTLLSKSLQILPEKFHGLTDTDMRYRQRYICLLYTSLHT